MAASVCWASATTRVAAASCWRRSRAAGSPGLAGCSRSARAIVRAAGRARLSQAASRRSVVVAYSGRVAGPEVALARGRRLGRRGARGAWADRRGRSARAASAARCATVTLCSNGSSASRAWLRYRGSRSSAARTARSAAARSTGRAPAGLGAPEEVLRRGCDSRHRRRTPIPTTFVVVQVRHTLQQAGATGAKSAARLVIGATSPTAAAARSHCRRDEVGDMDRFGHLALLVWSVPTMLVVATSRPAA